MPATLAALLAAALDGLGDYLATTEGLRDTDGVAIRTGPVDPLPSTDVIVLGEVTVAHGRPGLQGRQGTPTVNGWVIITRPGSGETAIRLVRARAAQVMGLVEAAIRADQTAAGAIAPPGGLQVATSGLTQSPVNWDGSAARQAQIPFSLSWTSHIP